MLKMYIAVLDDFPDYMVPTLVAHTVLGAHLRFSSHSSYVLWLGTSFRKVVVRVNQKEFNKILELSDIHVGHEENLMGGRDSCVVVCPREEVPNVLSFAKLWSPKYEN